MKRSKMQMCENDDRNLGMASNGREIREDIQSRSARQVDFKYHTINVTGLIDPQPRLSIGGFKYLILGRTDRESMGVVLSIFVMAIDQENRESVVEHRRRHSLSSHWTVSSAVANEMSAICGLANHTAMSKEPNN